MKKILFYVNEDEQEYRSKIKCPHCNSSRFWKHGTYRRGCFHRRHSRTPDCCVVQRYLCRGPSCNTTFSVPPPEVLPFCHFFRRDLLEIVRDLASGKSIASIARAFNFLDRRVISRVRSLMDQLLEWIQKQAQEVCGGFCCGFKNALKTLLRHYDWVKIWQMWYRTRYPKRWCHSATHTK